MQTWLWCVCQFQKRCIYTQYNTNNKGSQDNLLVRAPDSWLKGCEFESQQEQWNNFLLQSSLCPFHPRVTAMARKRPRSFCKKCRWQVTPKHSYTLEPLKTEWADYAAVQAECGNLSGNKLTCNWSGNTRLQSSQLAEPLWTDPGLNSGISLCELISTLKKKAQVGNELSNILPKSLHARKNSLPIQIIEICIYVSAQPRNHTP